METIKKEAEDGKPVFGICNGAQILVESGLIPGIKNNQTSIALTDNKRIQDGHVVGTGFQQRRGTRIKVILIPRYFTSIRSELYPGTRGDR